MFTKRYLVRLLKNAFMRRDWKLAIQIYTRLLKRQKFGKIAAVQCGFFLSQTALNLSTSNTKTFIKFLSKFRCGYTFTSARIANLLTNNSYQQAIEIIDHVKTRGLEKFKCIALFALYCATLDDTRRIKAISSYRGLFRKNKPTLPLAINYAQLLLEEDDWGTLRSFTEDFLRKNEGLLGAYHLHSIVCARGGFSDVVELPDSYKPFFLCCKSSLAMESGDILKRIEDIAQFISFRENMEDVAEWRKLLEYLEMSPTLHVGGEFILFEKWWQLLHFCGYKERNSTHLVSIKAKVIDSIQHLYRNS